MKPIKLSMQAFGPYAGKEEVDFSKLEQKSMFVISGPTGAGKTTIFDGICFAIYGRASGDDRNGPDLRSQFAKDELITEVSLEFELRGKRYLIKRSPQQEKKKTRGEGTTTQNAKAELIELTNQEILLAANVREVDEKIIEIIKLDCHQFRQIMMIPQGEFRKLLVSDSKDKEKILQKLFHTEHYKQIEDKLKDYAAQLRKSVERRVLERNSFISGIQSDENETLHELLEAEHQNIQEILSELTKIVNDDGRKIKELVKDLSEKEDRRGIIQKEIHHGITIIDEMNLLERLTKTKELLEARQLEIEEKVIAIENGHKALALQQVEDQCKQVEQEIVTKGQELSNAQTRLKDLQNILKEKVEILTMEEEKATEREALLKEMNQLQSFHDDVQSFASLENDVHRLTKELDQIKNDKGMLEAKAKNDENQIEECREKKEAASKAKLTYAEKSVLLTNQNSFLEKVSTLLKEKKQLITLEKHFSEAEDNREEIADVLDEVNEELHELQEAWRLGQASLLATQLTEDEACPVCGSTHHPNVAPLHEGIPTEETLKEAQKKLKKVEDKKQKLDEAYFEAKSQFEAQMEKVVSLADEVSMKLSYQMKMLALEEIEEKLQKECLMLREELDLLNQQTKSSETFDKELEKLVTELNKTKQAIGLCSEEYETKNTMFIEKRSDWARLSKVLPEEIRDEKAYSKKIAELQTKKSELEKALIHAQKEVNDTNKALASIEGSQASLQQIVSELHHRLIERKEQFQSKLLELGFDSVIEYHQVKKTTIEIREMEATVQAYREELRSVKDRHQDLAVKLEKVEKPDIEQLKENLSVIQNEINELQEEKNLFFHKIKTNETIFDKVQAITKEMASIEEEYKTVGELCDIASGKNTYRVTFERYVLAAFLDQILIAANGRLNKMTSGRYELLRKTDRSKGNIQSGLELLVFDHYTGGTRHVKTLSGGESFKASLSLALGLADVVQGYSGGVSMETMFIDEGFGTLDPESLENAIETLIDIQSTGRLVGIISHVPELKERIDARFEVIATQTGSIVKYYNYTTSM